MFTTADHEYMTLALRLAEKGLFSTTPNPRVGSFWPITGKLLGKALILKLANRMQKSWHCAMPSNTIPT
jgi:diaminohydroxyphosphoribosylaminopyrimidine deaminase/5-amino-6-(5-phosphoribosylamino)uracil reductase